MRPSFGGRRFKPTRENVHETDDLREYRHGRAVSPWWPKPRALRRRERSEGERRERYAEAVARAELGRFYWDARRDGELKAALKRRRKQRPGNGKARR
jgi:hypothetical protein